MEGTNISVITINLNNFDGLKKTIDSVAAQTYPYLEYIVIDGGSNDQSLELLDHPAISFAVSEKDQGIYEAMNKGIRAANGDYCLFLNSGDILLAPDTIQKAVDRFGKDQNADIYYGDLVINGQKLDYPATISLEFLLRRSVPHPSSFIRRFLFEPESLGTYRENFRMVSDWIFFLDAYLRQYLFVYLQMPITVFNTEGMSSNNQELNAKEREKALRSIFPNLAHEQHYFLQLAKYKTSRVYKYADHLHSFLRKLKK